MIRLVLLACLLPGAGAVESEHRVGSPEPQVDLAPADGGVGAHLARLERRINDLEEKKALNGRGAYAGGSGLRVELGGTGDESLLERLRRHERELTALRAEKTERERQQADTAAALASESDRRRQASERAAALGHVQESLVTARQVLTERQTAIDRLKAELAASELARLRAERAHYLLAAAVLRLPAVPGVELSDLQDSVRQEARNVLPSERSGE